MDRNLAHSMPRRGRLSRALGGLVLLLALVLPALAARPAAAQQDVMRIAAVVNEDVISIFDLSVRLAVAIRSSGFRDSPELRRLLAPQVLRAMVDERLQTQEARRLSIGISEQELASAIDLIEKQNRWEKGTFYQRLAATRVDETVVIDQIRNDLAWSKIVRRRFGPTVNITEDEVDEAVRRIEADRGKPEAHVAEIFLPVDEPDQEAEALGVAEDLLRQLRAGSSFAATARQFSKGATAAQGGDLGWIVQGRLSPELDRAIFETRPGQVSDPVRTFDGIYLLSVLERRTVLGGGAGGSSFHLAQVVLDASSAEPEARRTLVDELRATRDCAGFLAAARGRASPISGDLGTIALDDLPRDLKAAVVSLEGGQTTAPLPYQGGERVIMVCERIFAERSSNTTIDREAVRRDLTNRKLDLAARRYLRDLRRSAFIDMRI
jgi:peptidyl-prolyl cis-trans isomerase SurA